MGVLIFTHDAEKYRTGDYVEGGYVSSDPQVEGLTVIVHKRYPTAKECVAWLPHIAYRMVWVCAKPPKMKKNDSVIIDGVFKKQDYTRNIDATMRWSNRTKSFPECANVPVPLMLSFLRENNRDIALWRTLAKSFTNVPEDFQQALINFSHKPVRRMSWPKKKKSDGVLEYPFGIRESDTHWESIVRLSKEVANDLRRTEKKLLPKGIPKREQSTLDGWI